MRRYSHDSRNAALAAWAAWDQGKFWEMHDLLFDKAPYLERPELDKLAQELGLDMVRFRKVLDEMTHLPELQKNLDRVHDIDIWSTPTAIINGRVIKGAQPIENYRKVIDEILGESSWKSPFSTLWSFLREMGGPPEALADSGEFGRGKVPLYVRVPDARPVNEPQVGETAPDFTLPGVNDAMVTLSEFRGRKNVLLSFLPAAFTPV